MTFPIFGADAVQHNKKYILPPPKWRTFGEPFAERQDKVTREAPPMSADEERKGRTFQIGDLATPEGTERSKAIKRQVSAAIALRRPLLVTGNPGTGKSSLAYAIAYDLGLGKPLRWNITSRTALKDGQYTYDALDRLNDASLAGGTGDRPPLDKYLKLGPLGTALLPTKHPRVLLIDELDKADIDLPNDLLNVFEEGAFEISELVRAQQSVAYVRPADGKPPKGAEDPEDLVPIYQGRVKCSAFPIVVVTSNNEREFSPAFLRRCVTLRIDDPDEKTLKGIAVAQLEQQLTETEFSEFLVSWNEQRKQGTVATDQLLNAMFVLRSFKSEDGVSEDERKKIREALMAPLEKTGA